MQDRNALAHKITSIRHLLHAAAEVQAGCPSIATNLRTRATDLLTEVQAEVQAKVQADTTDRAAHWTHGLSEEQMNAVLDAINAGQGFDHVLKRLHTS